MRLAFSLRMFSNEVPLHINEVDRPIAVSELQFRATVLVIPVQSDRLPNNVCNSRLVFNWWVVKQARRNFGEYHHVARLWS